MRHLRSGFILSFEPSFMQRAVDVIVEAIEEPAECEGCRVVEHCRQSWCEDAALAPGVAKHHALSGLGDAIVVRAGDAFAPVNAGEDEASHSLHHRDHRRRRSRRTGSRHARVARGLAKPIGKSRNPSKAVSRAWVRGSPKRSAGTRRSSTTAAVQISHCEPQGT